MYYFIYLIFFMHQQLLLYWSSVVSPAMFPADSALNASSEKPLPRGFSPGKTTTVEISATNDQPVRHYNVHLPVDYPNNHGHAVIFSFHGHTRNMSTQEDLSQFSQEGLLINNVGIIAVYPQGIVGTKGGAAWQGAPYSASGVDDVSRFQLSFTFVDHKLII